MFRCVSWPDMVVIEPENLGIIKEEMPEWLDNLDRYDDPSFDVEDVLRW